MLAKPGHHNGPFAILGTLIASTASTWAVNVMSQTYSAGAGLQLAGSGWSMQTDEKQLADGSSVYAAYSSSPDAQYSISCSNCSSLYVVGWSDPTHGVVACALNGGRSTSVNLYTSKDSDHITPIVFYQANAPSAGANTVTCRPGSGSNLPSPILVAYYAYAAIEVAQVSGAATVTLNYINGHDQTVAAPPAAPNPTGQPTTSNAGQQDGLMGGVTGAGGTGVSGTGAKPTGGSSGGDASSGTNGPTGGSGTDSSTPNPFSSTARTIWHEINKLGNKIASWPKWVGIAIGIAIVVGLLLWTSACYYSKRRHDAGHEEVLEGETDAPMPEREDQADAGAQPKTGLPAYDASSKPPDPSPENGAMARVDQVPKKPEGDTTSMTPSALSRARYAPQSLLDRQNVGSQATLGSFPTNAMSAVRSATLPNRAQTAGTTSCGPGGQGIATLASLPVNRQRMQPSGSSRDSTFAGTTRTDTSNVRSHPLLPAASMSFRDQQSTALLPAGTMSFRDQQSTALLPAGTFRAGSDRTAQAMQNATHTRIPATTQLATSARSPLGRSPAPLSLQRGSTLNQSTSMPTAPGPASTHPHANLGAFHHTPKDLRTYTGDIHYTANPSASGNIMSSPMAIRPRPPYLPSSSDPSLHAQGMPPPRGVNLQRTLTAGSAGPVPADIRSHQQSSPAQAAGRRTASPAMQQTVPSIDVMGPTAVSRPDDATVLAKSGSNVPRRGERMPLPDVANSAARVTRQSAADEGIRLDADNIEASSHHANTVQQRRPSAPAVPSENLLAPFSAASHLHPPVSREAGSHARDRVPSISRTGSPRGSFTSSSGPLDGHADRSPHLTAPSSIHRAPADVVVDMNHSTMTGTSRASHVTDTQGGHSMFSRSLYSARVDEEGRVEARRHRSRPRPGDQV